MVQYSLTNEEGKESLTLFFKDGAITTIQPNHYGYKDIRNLILSGGKVKDKAVKELLTPSLALAQKLRRLSERVTYSNGGIFFDGDLIDTSIAKHIKRILTDDPNDTDSWVGLVAFLEKLSSNPSKRSRKALYDFLVRYNITIDRDGDFYAYKGLNKDATSIHSGFGIVNGVPQNGHLLNEVGTVIEIPRSQVDPDKNNGCSTGLHAGSYGYASGFANGLLSLVKINPRDVVSVPHDCTFQKIRVSRYRVVAHEVQAEVVKPTLSVDYDTEEVSNPELSELLEILDSGFSAIIQIDEDDDRLTVTIVDSYPENGNVIVVDEDGEKYEWGLDINSYGIIEVGERLERYDEEEDEDTLFDSDEDAEEDEVAEDEEASELQSILDALAGLSPEDVEAQDLNLEVTLRGVPTGLLKLETQRFTGTIESLSKNQRVLYLSTDSGVKGIKVATITEFEVVDKFLP